MTSSVAGRRFRPMIALAGSATEPFAPALMLAWTDPDPGGQMACIAEGRGIPTHFGKEDLQDPPADSGDGVESFQLLVLLFAALGTFAGILEFLYFTFTATPGMGGISLKLFLALVQIIAFLAGLLQILQILKIIR